MPFSGPPTRGKQKFLFTLLGDGVGICFLTNFRNFWDFEDSKDFRILEYSKNFRKIASIIFYPKKGREIKIAAKFLLRFAYMYVDIIKDKRQCTSTYIFEALWGWLIRRNLVTILDFPYFYLLLWLSFMTAYFMETLI